MNASVHRQLNRRKRRILRRIKNQPGVERHQPMMTASNIHYEIADRTRAISPGGIGAIHLLAQRLGLVRDINDDLHLLAGDPLGVGVVLPDAGAHEPGRGGIRHPVPGVDRAAPRRRGSSGSTRVRGGRGSSSTSGRAA